jgi:hypothetical protein
MLSAKMQNFYESIPDIWHVAGYFKASPGLIPWAERILVVDHTEPLTFVA